MKNIICYFFSFLVEAMILWQYSSHLFSARRKPREKMLMLCVFYFILFGVSLFESVWFNTTLYFLLNFIFLIIQCCPNWYTAVFHASILTAVMTTSELIVYGITKRFAPHFLNNSRDFYHLLLFSVFSKLIFFAVTFILMHLMKKTNKNAEQYDRSVFLFVFIPVTSIFIMFTLISIGESVSLPQSLDWMVAMGAVFLLISNLLVFGIYQYNQTKNIEFTDMQLLLQKEANAAEYYGMLLSQSENQNILIHDIKKHLQSIDMLNDKKESDKISAYIKQLMLSSDLKETAHLCDNEMLSAILCRYKRQCDRQKISFHTDIRCGTVDFITDTDLTSLFCNLLDNALEAASGIPESFIEISTSQRAKTPFVVITIINSSRKNPFSDSSKMLSTNKADKRRHGFGLKSIRRTVRKYHGDIQMYYNDDTLTFHSIITLKQ